MREEKFNEKFSKVINESGESIGKCLYLVVSTEKSFLTGLTNSAIQPHSAIVAIRKSGQTYAKGYFDGEIFARSTIDVLDATQTLQVGIDLRKEDRNIVYYQSGETYEKVSSRVKWSNGDAMCIFLECIPMVYMIVCSFDPTCDEVIVEIVSSSDKPMQRFLKATVRQFLSDVETAEKRSLDDPEGEMGNAFGYETSDYES